MGHFHTSVTFNLTIHSLEFDINPLSPIINRHILLSGLHTFSYNSCCENLLKIKAIHRTEKDGNCYIYPLFLAHENPKTAHKNAQKRSEREKLRENIHKIWPSVCAYWLC